MHRKENVQCYTTKPATGYSLHFHINHRQKNSKEATKRGRPLRRTEKKLTLRAIGIFRGEQISFYKHATITTEGFL